MTRRTIQATIVGADSLSLEVKLRCKTTDDFSKLVQSDGFFRVIDLHLDAEEPTEKKWADNGASRRIIEARIKEKQSFLNDLKSAAKTYEAAVLAGEIAGLVWCRDKFTDAPSERELHDKDHPCLDSPCMKCGNPQPKLKAWRQDWEESERGWGVRPDGHTLHLSLQDLKTYVHGYTSAIAVFSPVDKKKPASRRV
jgi:hypothetical protein